MKRHDLATRRFPRPRDLALDHPAPTAWRFPRPSPHSFPPRLRRAQLPSKVWQLSPDTIVGEVKQQEYHVRHARTSTLWAVATKAYDSQKMVRVF